MSQVMTISILMTVIGAATPLLLAALGELVAEKSGVLNLGVEGMMLVGAVTGFAVTSVTGVFQGLLLFFLLASDFLTRYRVRLVSERPEVARA